MKKYRGVMSYTPTKHVAFIKINRKQRYLGEFKTAEEAARQYDTICVMHRGFRAKTNFPITNYLK